MLEALVSSFLRRRMEKIGAISRFIAQQCGTPWSAILDVLPGAAKDPVLGLLTFGADDIVRGYLRPRGLKGPRKFRRRQRWYNRPTIPEIGEEVGKRLPGAQEIKGRAVGTAEKLGWIADGAIQRALYYVMVFDAVLDTWYNSVLALQRQGFCTTPTRASGSPFHPEAWTDFLRHGQWSGLQSDELLQVPGILRIAPHHTYITLNRSRVRWSWRGSFAFMHAHPPGITIEFRAVVTDGPRPIFLPGPPAITVPRLSGRYYPLAFHSDFPSRDFMMQRRVHAPGAHRESPLRSITDRYSLFTY